MWRSWESRVPARRRFLTFWRRLISPPAGPSCLEAGISHRYRRAGWHSSGGIIWGLCSRTSICSIHFLWKIIFIFPLVLANVPYKEMAKRLNPIAKMLGIKNLLKKYPYEVSGGQKQRAAVARALITQPKLILADEPTGALDSRSSEELLRLFSAVNRSGQTILMVTHSTAAASKANRVLFIKDGEVFHQIYRGEDSDEQFYQKISDTLTILMTGGEGR